MTGAALALAVLGHGVVDPSKPWLHADDEGVLRRCFFVGGVIGNLFRDGWMTLDAPDCCPVLTCHCYVGHLHVVELDFRSVYGKHLAARIPREYHDTPR